MHTTIFQFCLISLAIVMLPFGVAGSVSSSVPDQADDGVIKVRPIGGSAGIAPETIQWKILELALQKSGQAYDLELSKHIRLPKREAAQMQMLGDEGNIIWAGSIHPQRDKMRPVGATFLRGLSCYRYLFVRSDDVDRYSHIRTADDLKEFPILTGQVWGANPILEAKGFDLRKGASANLPRMLMAGRADVLLWPVTGAFNLYEKFGVKDLDISIVPNVLVRIPQAPYFWVTQQGSQALYDAVTFGLSVAVEDGSLDEVIRNFPRVGDAYIDLVSNDYEVIEIDNPLISEKAQADLAIYGLEVGAMANEPCRVAYVPKAGLSNGECRFHRVYQENSRSH